MKLFHETVASRLGWLRHELGWAGWMGLGLGLGWIGIGLVRGLGWCWQGGTGFRLG
jgi:hypothetical protein